MMVGKNEINNLKILEKLLIFSAKNPDLTFQELLNQSGCTPVEFIRDVSNPKVGQYGVKDLRSESSLKTLSRVNMKTRINNIKK